MEDFLNRISFGSAAPLRSFLVMGVFIYLFVCGTFTLFLGYRMKNALIAALGVFGTIFPLTIVSASYYVASQIELNPIVQASDLVGSWQSGSDQMEFLSDGSFRLNSQTHAHGTWSLNDYNLDISITDGGYEPWRVIKVGDHFRLLRHFPRETDEWNGDLEFKRQ